MLGLAHCIPDLAYYIILGLLAGTAIILLTVTILEY
jgi:hypothetical protein